MLSFRFCALVVKNPCFFSGLYADLGLVSEAIEREREFLGGISQQILRMPELQFQEVRAHATLTCALRRRGFHVEKHYFMPTAFRASFSAEKPGPTVAVLLEYDALPELGHACGHNLIAEAGLAAAIAVRDAMLSDSNIPGKVVALGTPAEEGGGGKIQLLELGAFDDVDVALMVHPTPVTRFAPVLLCNLKYFVDFKGKEAHAAALPWGGRNALDAAVACYMSISMLRQQVKPSCRIHMIFTSGGTAPNIIPSAASMTIQLRALKTGELGVVSARVEDCIQAAAMATGCEVQLRRDDPNAYQNLVTNRVVAYLFKGYCEQLGMKTENLSRESFAGGSSDMGNVSHRVPAMHPFYAIGTRSTNHTAEFAAAAGTSSAQEATLLVAKAMAMTAIAIMRRPDTLRDIRRQFQEDIEEEER